MPNIKQKNNRKSFTKKQNHYVIESRGSESIPDGIVAIVEAKNIIEIVRKMKLEQVDDQPMTFLIFNNLKHKGKEYYFCEVFDIYEDNSYNTAISIDEAIEKIHQTSIENI